MNSIQQVNSVPESTQLNGTPDNSVKQPKSSNKKKSAKSAVSVESVTPVDNTNQVAQMQSPQLFTDEIGIADEAKSATRSNEPSTTYARYPSCVANMLTQSDRTDESNKSVEPSATDLSDATIESTAPKALPSAADSTDTVIEPRATTATVQPDTSDAPDEAKASRVSRKQSREELDSYKAAYLVPFKIGKRHTVVLDDDLWNELDYIVRRIGDSKANTTAYANSIIRNHLLEIRHKVEAWRKALKSTLITLFTIVITVPSKCPLISRCSKLSAGFGMEWSEFMFSYYK